jgi:hypothetical protein
MLNFTSVSIIFSLIGLIYTYYTIHKEKTHHLKRVAAKSNELEYARNQIKITEEEINKKVEHFHGKEKADKVLQKIIWLDMPDYLLVATLGKPEHVKESYYKGNRSEDYFYGGQFNRLGNVKYSLQVIIENKFVVGWKDLK